MMVHVQRRRHRAHRLDRVFDVELARLVEFQRAGASASK
jgi:hypothetical protein